MKMIICLMILSDSIIFNSDIKYKELACSIAKVETNLGKTKSSTQTNNLFGFKKYGKLKRYKSKNDSVLDYILFERRIIRIYNVKSEIDYLNKLSKFYARDPNWKRKVLKNLNK